MPADVKYLSASGLTARRIGGAASGVNINMKNNQNSGMVYLIGAGPGDAGLITLKGVECIKKADVVVYDYLVNEELLKYCREGCEKIYVGKKAKDHTLSQPEINSLLREKAKNGGIVARLKGGDPFVFGRGGEEALDLAAQDIKFEVVPGVTAAVAALAYAGIPITHRCIASTATLITGHEDPSNGTSDINWEMISKGVGTLVFYMGVNNLERIVSNLNKHGRPGETPAALIRLGTLNRQETLTGTLNNIVKRARERNFKPPALIVAGEVINLREKLRWFDKRPLFGKKIIITRSRKQASTLSKSLRELGAVVIEFPTIAIQPVEDFSELDKTIGEIDTFSWVVFTSVNGVDMFFDRLSGLWRDSRALNSVRIAVIGKGTADALWRFGLKPDLTPETFTSEGTVEAFKAIKEDYTSERVLLPSSEIARDYIPRELAKMGAEVVTVPVYLNLVPGYSEETISDAFKDDPDLVTFSSSSTVSNLVGILRKHNKDHFIARIKGASIGPVTTKTAENAGISIVVDAAEHTIPGLVYSILEYFKKRPSES